MTEVILEIQGLDAPAVRACLQALGGRDRTRRRMAGRGWTAVVAEEPAWVGPWQVNRTILHILGAREPVTGLVHELQAMAARM